MKISLLVLAIRAGFAWLHTTSRAGALNIRDLLLAVGTYLLHGGLILALFAAIEHDAPRIVPDSPEAAAFLAALAGLAVDLLQRYASSPR